MTTPPKKQFWFGFTLLETSIYIALFTLVIGGFLIAVYQIMEATTRTQDKVVIQEEGNFLLYKIGWALTGTQAIDLPTSNSSSDTLRVQNGGVVLEFRLQDGHLQLSRDSAVFVNLSSDNVTVSNLNFSHADPDGAGGKPASVTASFLVDGQYFETLKYLRI